MSNPQKTKISEITLHQEHRFTTLKEDCIRENKLASSHLFTLCDELIHEPEEVSRNSFVKHLIYFGIIFIVNFGSSNSPSFMPHCAQTN